MCIRDSVYAESGDTPAEPGTSVTVLQDDFGQEGSPVTEEPDKEVPAEGTEPEVPAEGTEPEEPDKEVPAEGTEPEEPDKEVPAEGTEPEEPDKEVPAEDMETGELDEGLSSGDVPQESDELDGPGPMLNAAVVQNNGKGWQIRDFGGYSAAVYIDENGNCLVGPHYLEQGPNGEPGGYFFFYDNGARAWGEVISWNGNTYETQNGKMLTGLVTKDFGGYAAAVYYDPNQSGAMVKQDVVTIGDKFYAFYANGARVWSDLLYWDHFYMAENGYLVTGLQAVSYTHLTLPTTERV